MTAIPKKFIRRRIYAMVAITGAILFFGYDLIVDAFLEHEYLTAHFIIELIVFVGVSMALIFSARDLIHLRALLEIEKKRTQALSVHLQTASMPSWMSGR